MARIAVRNLDDDVKRRLRVRGRASPVDGRRNARRPENWWFAEADAIRNADFNLSANRRRPLDRAKVEHRDPMEIIEEQREIKTRIPRGDRCAGRGSARSGGGMTSPIVQSGDLCLMERQGLDPHDSVAAKLPFVSVENVESHSGAVNSANGLCVGNQGSTAFRFDERHILHAKLRPYRNKVATPDFAGKCSAELIPLLPRDGVDREFVAYLLRRNQTVEYVMASVFGSRMPRTVIIASRERGTS